MVCIVSQCRTSQEQPVGKPVIWQRVDGCCWSVIDLFSNHRLIAITSVRRALQFAMAKSIITQCISLVRLDLISETLGQSDLVKEATLKLPSFLWRKPLETETLV